MKVKKMSGLGGQGRFRERATVEKRKEDTG